MDEYAQLKLEYYGKPIKAILNYKKVFAVILLMLSLIHIIDTLIFSISNIGLDFILNLTYAILLIVSMLSFSLLDKTTFYLNMATITFKVVWVIVSTGLSIATTLEMFGIINVSANQITKGDPITQGALNLMLGAMNGGIIGVTIVSLFFQLLILAYLIAVAVTFITHKKLFFTPFKQFKIEHMK